MLRALRATIRGLILVAVLSGCATTSLVYHSPDAQFPPLEPSVVVLPSDVVVSRMTAGGNLEARVDWSETVSSALRDAMKEQLYSRGVRFKEYGETLRDQDVDAIRQINVLLDAIELSQLKAAGATSRGTSSMGGDRDYVLGESERGGMREFGTDYALLMVLRANRASGGRIATAVLASVAGIPMETSSIRFRSALIDLRDGHVKWANFDDSALQDVGDLLKASEKKWSSAVDHLLSDFPL